MKVYVVCSIDSGSNSCQMWAGCMTKMNLVLERINQKIRNCSELWTQRMYGITHTKRFRFLL